MDRILVKILSMMDFSKLSSLHDEDLLKLAQQGNEEAFSFLYERHKERVLNYSYSILGEPESPWDVLQETFLYLLKKLPTYEPKAKFTTLLYKVVKNISVDLAKKKKRILSLPEDRLKDLATTEGDVCEQFLYKENLENMEAIFLALPDVYREILYLKIMEELDYKEISEILDCPLGTVKSRLHYGWKKMKEMMDKRK